MTAPAMAEETVLLHAAGSLRGALTEVAKGFEAAGLGKVQAKFGASGLLKRRDRRWRKGGSVRLRQHGASAGAGIARSAAGRWCCSRATGCARWCGPASRSRRHRCWTACSTRRSSSAPRRRRPIRRATTPGRCFARPRRSSPAPTPRSRRRRCSSPAGPSSPPAPQGRSVYGELVAQGAADIFLTYCTNALAAQRENPAQQIVQLPDELAVGADYGLTVMNGASAGGVQIRAVHSLGGRPAHAREARFCRACFAAIGIGFDHDRATNFLQKELIR